MKAVCQAAWLWTVAFGNFFVIIVAEGRIFENQVFAQSIWCLYSLMLTAFNTPCITVAYKDVLLYSVLT